MITKILSISLMIFFCSLFFYEETNIIEILSCTHDERVVMTNIDFFFLLSFSESIHKNCMPSVGKWYFRWLQTIWYACDGILKKFRHYFMNDCLQFQKKSAEHINRI